MSKRKSVRQAQRAANYRSKRARSGKAEDVIEETLIRRQAGSDDFSPGSAYDDVGQLGDVIPEGPAAEAIALGDIDKVLGKTESAATGGAIATAEGGLKKLAKGAGKLGKFAKFGLGAGGIIGALLLLQELYDAGPGSRKEQRRGLAEEELLGDDQNRMAISASMEDPVTKLLDAYEQKAPTFQSKAETKALRDREGLAGLAARERGVLSQISYRTTPTLEELMAGLGVTP